MSRRMNRWWQQWLIVADEARTRAKQSFQASELALHDLRTPRLGDLEPRLLFSATPIDLAAMDTADESAMVATVNDTQDSSDQESIESLSESASAQQMPSEVVIIDSAVPDLQQLLDDLDQSGRTLDVFVLDADRDGIDQITEILDSRTGLDSIHIVSHAENGQVRLGDLWLGDANLDGYAGQLAAWQSSMTANADILFYGCDLADSVEGRTLLESVSTLTGADVAASDDDTGHSSYGGDWDLEHATGSIESQVPFSGHLQEQWLGKLATITVGTTVDEDNGLATISLREAIDAAADGDTIIVGAGIYDLTLGDLDIDKDLTIIGDHARTTIINVTQAGDRAFELKNDSVVTMSGFTIQGGQQNNGGAIYVNDNSVLNLSHSTLQGNSSDEGGAIQVRGTAHLSSVLLFNNTATSNGGAINFHNANGGSLTNVTISGNTATSQGGGIYTDTNITVTSSTITANHANDGGGIRTSGGTVTISNTIVAGNTAGSASIDVLGSFSSNGFNLIEVLNGTGGFDDDITGVSAGLAALANNGGQTNSHALLASSAALNAGSNFGAAPQDQTGNNRDSIPDMGAFESGLQSTKLYWADEGSNSIFRSNGDGTAVQEILSGLGGPSGLEIDLVGGKLYWIETDNDNLYSSNLDGSGITTLDTGNLSNPSGLGLDLINGYLYIADNGNGVNNAIRRFDLDGSNFTTIVTHLGGEIGDVAVDGVAGKLYFTHHNNGNFDGSIRSVNVSGGSVSTLTSGLVGPRSLVIDQPAGRIYYTDDGSGGSNFVVSMRLSDGGDSQVLGNAGLDQPHGVAVDAATGKVYWSDANNNSIYRSNLDGSGDETILSGLSSPHEIVAVSLAGSAPVGQADTYTVNEDTTLDSNSQWFDAAWGFRRTLSFDNGDRTEDLSNFPVLIELDASRVDYSQTQNGGEDLRFIDGDGNVLSHQIESWDEAGSSYVWVRVPQVDQSTDTDFIWMYYGNASASDGQNATAVWGSDYKAVYHHQGNATDASSNGNDGGAAGVTDVPGFIAGGAGFDGVNDIVTVNSSASIDNIFASGGTISAWFNAADWGENDYGRILDKASGTTPSPNGWSLSLDKDNQSLIFEIGFTGQDGRWRVSPNSVTLGQWHQVTVVYDASSSTNTPTIYLDGVAQTIIQSSNPTGSYHSDAGLDLQIGNYSALNRTFDGTIDETRLLDTTVSANWVAAQYESGTDDFVVFGYQQTSAGVLGNDTDADGNTLSASLVGSDPANASAFNLNSDGTFTYTPNANFVGTDSFTYQVSDGTTWSAPISVTIDVQPVNDAPTASNATLAAIAEDTANPAGDTVANLFGGSFNDVDNASSMTGIIVVGNDANSSTQGEWQYSSDNTTWFNIGSVDDAGNGLLVSTTSKIRFVPVADFNGTVTSLVVRAVDNTFGGGFSSTNAGQNRQTADTSSLTPSSSFGNSTNTLGTSVTGANDTPTIGGTSNTAVNDNATMQPFAAVALADIDGDDITVAITLSGGDANGQFSAASLSSSGFTKIGAGQYLLSARTTTTAQAAIRSLVFDPTENQIAVGSTVVTTFQVTVDDGTADASSNSTVTATSINDAATDITLGNTTVVENNAGATIGTVGVADPDPGDSHTLAVNDTRFEIIGTSLKLKAGQSLDHETDPTVSVTITATDQAGSGLDYSESFTITVDNANEAPTDITLSNSSVTENISGATIGTVGISDPDSGDTHTWAVDDTRFEVVGTTLRLKAGQSLDHETDPTVSVSITATDQAGSGLDYSESFTITVDNANEAPTDITLSNTTIAENNSGAAVGTVGVVDPDAGDTHLWTVNDTRFEVVGTTLKLKSGQSLNHETESSVSIILTATDQAGTGTGYTESFTVTVSDVNESPTDITLDNTTVQGGSGGANVGQIAAIDPEGGTHSWLVNDSRFTVTGGVLKLKPSQSINATAEPIVNLVITATDTGGLMHTKSFAIAVTPPAIPNPVIPGGGTGTTDPTPDDGPDADDVTDDSSGDTDSGETDSSDEASEDENSSSSDDAGSAKASGNLAMAPGAINAQPSATNVAASSIVIASGGQTSDADGKATADSTFANTFFSANSSLGSSSSVSSDTTLDRVTSGLMRYGLGSTSLATAQANFAMMAKPGAMWDEMDQRMQGIESQIQGDLIIVGAAGAATSSFMVGVAAWGLRTGFLASGLMAQLPAWRAVDPLLIMQGSGDGDDESLEDLIKRRSEELDDLETPNNPVGDSADEAI